MYCRELFTSLDRAEKILSKQRFIAGSRFTEADLRLFVTLIRFDEVSCHESCSAKSSSQSWAHLLARCTLHHAVMLHAIVRAEQCPFDAKYAMQRCHAFIKHFPCNILHPDLLDTCSGLVESAHTDLVYFHNCEQSFAQSYLSKTEHIDTGLGDACRAYDDTLL